MKRKDEYTLEELWRKLICCVEGCNRKTYRRTYCPTHYRQFLAGEPFRNDIRSSNKITTCLFPDCNKDVNVRGVCQGHYLQYINKGVLIALRPRTQFRRAPKFEGEQPLLCIVECCINRATNRGYCQKHYREMLGNKPFTPVYEEPKICSFRGCKEQVHAEKLCKGHYFQQVQGKQLTTIIPIAKQQLVQRCINGCGRMPAPGYDTCHRCQAAQYRQSRREKGLAVF